MYGTKCKYPRREKPSAGLRLIGHALGVKTRNHKFTARENTLTRQRKQTISARARARTPAYTHTRRVGASCEIGNKFSSSPSFRPLYRYRPCFCSFRCRDVLSTSDVFPQILPFREKNRSRRLKFGGGGCKYMAQIRRYTSLLEEYHFGEAISDHSSRVLWQPSKYCNTGPT